MADKILKGLKFPGGKDTYIINSFQEKEIILTQGNWIDNSQIIAVPGIKTTSKVISTPAPLLANLESYNKAFVFCEQAQENQLIYKCKVIPDSDITINILYD